MATPPEDSDSEKPENGDSSETKQEKVSLVVPLIIAASFFMGPLPSGSGPFFLVMVSECGGAVLSRVSRRPGVRRGRVGGRASLARLGPDGVSARRGLLSPLAGDRH